jgi:hypothetical protein
MAEKSGFAGARVPRAVCLAFSFVVTLSDVLEMSLTAALDVTNTFAGSRQESRVRHEQTHTEEKAEGSPPRPRVSKQLGNRVEPLAIHVGALHRDSMLSAMSHEANSPD